VLDSLNRPFDNSVFLRISTTVPPYLFSDRTYALCSSLHKPSFPNVCPSPASNGSHIFYATPRCSHSDQMCVPQCQQRLSQFLCNTHSDQICVPPLPATAFTFYTQHPCALTQIKCVCLSASNGSHNFMQHPCALTQIWRQRGHEGMRCSGSCSLQGRMCVSWGHVWPQHSWRQQQGAGLRTQVCARVKLCG